MSSVTPMTRLVSFIAMVAISPWLAYLLLSRFADPAAAWAFVSSCLWVGTPILVIVAALRGFEAGRTRPNDSFGSISSNTTSDSHSAPPPQPRGDLVSVSRGARNHSDSPFHSTHT